MDILFHNDFTSNNLYNFLTIDVTSKLISKKIGEEEYVYSIC